MAKAEDVWGRDRTIEIPPDLRDDVRRLIHALGPESPHSGEGYSQALPETEIVRRWNMLVRPQAYEQERTRPLQDRLRNILMDTGDNTQRCFNDWIFLGNGTASGWQVRKLQDRLSYAVQALGGTQQGGTRAERDEAVEDIKDVVRDIAMALLGAEITFVPKGYTVTEVTPTPAPKPVSTRDDGEDDVYSFAAKILLGKL
jgi:hypothetical protein